MCRRFSKPPPSAPLNPVPLANTGFSPFCPLGPPSAEKNFFLSDARLHATNRPEPPWAERLFQGTPSQAPAPLRWYGAPIFSVSKKSFRPAWCRNTPSAQPVSVRFAPENREPSSKRARFLRHWRRVARFPLLGYLRAKSRLRRLRSETRLRAQSRAHSLPARGMQHP